VFELKINKLSGCAKENSNETVFETFLDLISENPLFSQKNH
jgi:hypothetical protein